MIHIGCCGFVKSQAAYFQHFRLIEIQQTFYKPPLPKTALRWREEAPPAFAFALKAWQLITHPRHSPTYARAGIDIPEPAQGRYGSFRPTAEVMAAWERSLEIALALEAAVVVFQCPASFRPTPQNKDNMRAFFGQARREGLTFAWEPRGDWPDADIAALCRELDLVHAVDPFKRAPVTAGLAYFRLHGIDGYDYHYRYSDDDLARLEEACRPFAESYVLFNTASMWDDALRFQGRLPEGRSFRR
jgi:uncharacterized protein YecE (DUF72 family)